VRSQEQHLTQQIFDQTDFYPTFELKQKGGALLPFHPKNS
jgi:hypothetical protein